jgi:hypothetical protein
MNLSSAEDARELVRFLVSSVGHPVVLDRNDCALLAAQVERAQILEALLLDSASVPVGREPCSCAD